MTASRLVTIFCDAPDCSQWEDAGVASTAAAARAALKRRGWRVDVLQHVDPNARPLFAPRLDFCPAHA